ncbi:hypothetical protein PTSG_07197 [Salpingoeca rosetta]|uniref:Uncharacterized protein n=1 Tax=Salpingoeca rosetta (strain ATCC 50818 / BSB-021) TaxID=946362 RepID=F2UEC3_SALR5|nr:uncharacterized protein PTSG_07197 [Salpingoeca rosetta]EGD74973.1 hypothetical protein PTSG_07197 [Salpingoeca rosetta]|eukprot:XP_004992618.1 hypothetical protein PTSG_07197 [Salpingoeca rosetta]
MASRVSWDISGTILTSAGHDRHFPAFQLLPGGEWRDFDAGKLPSKDIAPKHDDDQEQ